MMCTEIYYTTHQFFLSSQAIYLVVWDMRLDISEARIDYWLESIVSRTGGAPIIIVGTHADDEMFEFSGLLEEKLLEVESTFVSRFPSIVCITAVSCFNMSGASVCFVSFFFLFNPVVLSLTENTLGGTAGRVCCVFVSVAMMSMF